MLKEDIVLADASEYYRGMAEPAVIIEDTSFKIVAGLHTIALRPRSVDSLFIYYLIKSSLFRKHPHPFCSILLDGYIATLPQVHVVLGVAICEGFDRMHK